MIIRNSLIRSMINKGLALLVLSLLLSACVSASNKQFNLSQDSLKLGDYNSAFNHAAQSLEHEINNKKTLATFPGISQAAFNYHLSQAKNSAMNKQWDQTVQHYNAIASMQGRIEAIQVRLNAYIALEQKNSAREMDPIQAVLAITSPDVREANRGAKKSAADDHYQRALSLAQSKQYRDAVAEFKHTNSFIRCYRDACILSEKYQQLADKADALRYYNQGQMAASHGEYRNAQHAFSESIKYIPGFRDADKLAAHYRQLANMQDADIHYQRGLAQAEAGHYRLAANAFSRAIDFVTNYKNSQQLFRHYQRLANEDDAAAHYNHALSHLDQDEFLLAAAEFRRADQFVPGFRDALQQARWADALVPPDLYQIKELVIHEIQDHGMQARWYGNYTRKDFVSMSLGHVVVKEGHFKRHRGVWIYPVYIEMSGVLQSHDGVRRPIATSTTERFILHRNKHGQWEAEFRHR
ncbi:MAG: hypothetical protein Q9M17_01225 [Mariprofundus sp.]|nr:hypothetical protein [Mariprofundus sp.]